MIEHRIRVLREQRQLSQTQLGEMVGRTKHQISRLEIGDTKLDLATARKIANALDVPLAELVGVDTEDEQPVQSGFAEDLAPYKAGDADPLSSFQSDNCYLFTVLTDVLDGARISRGDVVIIDIGQDRVAQLRPLDVVQVLYHPPGQPNTAISLLRQFVPPRLLITNAAKDNLPSLNVSTDDAHIVGIVVGTHRRMG